MSLGVVAPNDELGEPGSIELRASLSGASQQDLNIKQCFLGKIRDGEDA